MLISEIHKLYRSNEEVVSLITTEDIEVILTQQLGLKKSDFEINFWDEIVSRCHKAISNHITEKLLFNLMGKELSEFVMEGPNPTQEGHKQ